MLKTHSEIQFYERWRKLQIRACCPSGKTPFFYLKKKPEPFRMQSQTLNMNLEGEKLN